MKYKAFFLINGLMLLLVYGSLSFIVSLEKQLIQKNIKYIINHQNKKFQTFAKIERIQNKSFFGYEHYYFTLSYWYQGEKKFILKKVSSSLYYKYKEGNQIEAIVIDDLWDNPQIFLVPQIFEENTLLKTKYKNLEEITNIFLGLGLLFLFFYFMLNYKNKNVLHEG
jgi:hypothetical protein